MPKIASISGVMVGVVAMALMFAPALAAEEPPAGETAAPPTPSGPPKGYECHDKALTGSGPGFKSSQEDSEEAALADWLAKAQAIYADADWKTTKDPVMECVKQGLYSKCFATAVPCHPKPKAQ
jgi:hypothetical protein